MKKIILRALAVFGVLIAYLLIFIVCAITVVFRGPSPHAKDLLVSTLMETSALKFVCRAYFSDAEIDMILHGEDTSRIDDYIASLSEREVTIPKKDENTDNEEISDITIEDVYGETYCGKMMIIADPSRVSVRVVDKFNTGAGGLLLSEVAAEDGVVAAFNGGAFVDDGGAGNGGMPRGVVIKDGKILNEAYQNFPTVIGFDSDHKLIVGNMSAQAALDAGIVEAVSFWPVLIKNGVVVPQSGTGGGLNPRTAIGQRDDGAILVLAIDGRQPHSLGATYSDLAAIMEDYGAVNAANLDGGSSTMLFYEGEMINSLGSAVGERRIPTCFVVTDTVK